MSEKNAIILEKIKSGKTFIQIMKDLNISYKSLIESISEIIDCNYQFDKKLLFDGSILLKIKEELKITDDNILSIDYNNEPEFRALFISDLHIGSSKDRIDLVEKACNYAISNRIKYVFNLGDFVENTYTNSELRLKSIDDQIKCIIEEYPCDRRLTHIVLYGNHDYYSLSNNQLDIAQTIEKNRADIVNAGYGRGYVGIGRDYICLEHECPDRPRELRGISHIKFIGHSHMYKLYNEYKKQIFVPALSDEFPSNYSQNPLKGFLDVEFYLNNIGLINKLSIKHYINDYSFGIASKSTVVLQRKKKNIDINEVLSK